MTSLLSDGILCDGYIWKYLWDELSSVTDVAHWHYRGHGRSGTPRDPGAVDMATLAADLDDVRTHLGDGPVVLFGHSMGCQVVLEAYRRRPEGIRALVLLCGCAGRVTETFHGTDLLARALPTVERLAKRRPGLVRALWGRLPPALALKAALRSGEVDRDALRPEDLLPYLEHMIHVDFPMFLAMLKSAGEHSAADLLPQIDVPVLVVAGEKDTFTPPQLAASMAGDLPRGRLLLVPGATHVAPLERHDLVDDEIRRFLTDTVGV